MKKFLFYTLGDRNKASSRVRAYWVADELQARGYKVFLEHKDSFPALFLFALMIPSYDVVFFQKTYSRWHCLLLRWANVWRKITVLDLDDAPSRINDPVTLKNVEFMMRNVSLVTVGSKYLYDYAKQYQPNVSLIPSSISLKYYQPQERSGNDKSVCLGWIGNGRHYKKDLITILKEPLTAIAQKYKIRFKIIGACGEEELYNMFGNIPGLECDFIDQLNWADPTAVAESLKDVDVGLYPLLPGGSNQYKCGFKALEYMAMKIPVVSSMVAENIEIVKEGDSGFFTDTVDEWIDVLIRLIQNNDLCMQMGQAGRKIVEEKYSTAKTVDTLENILAYLY